MLSIMTQKVSRSANVLSYARGDGVEAAMCMFHGSKMRSDRNLYHVTMSLDEGHRAAEANKLIGSVIKFYGQLELTGEFQILERDDD